MTAQEPCVIKVHDDTALFREAVNLTAAETAFAARLIEKDYFCSVLLEHLAAVAGEQLVFKGGTCLAKVHAEFYRLSEDLDFAFPMAVDASRSERSNRAAGLKEALAALPRSQPCFRVVEPLQGANESTQYIGNVSYVSVLSREEDTINIEISLREPLLTPAVSGAARTILLDPITGASLVPTVPVRCLSKSEAVAEKFRAALTRREAAIRDFYDLDYAVRKHDVRAEDASLIALVKQKLAVPGNEPVRMGPDRLAELHEQLDARLKPVLREQDFREFDLNRAFEMVGEMAKAVS
jgi:predicted nucleotidyltransferase component of viral defense system